MQVQVSKYTVKLTLELVSDPDHPRYGKHLSQHDVNDLIRPSDESLALVQDWLQQHIDFERVDYRMANDFMSFSLPIAKAESLLQTNYSIYRHRDGSELVRTTEWSLPLYLHEHVVAIQPSTSFLRSLPQVDTFMSFPRAAIADVALANSESEHIARNTDSSVPKVCNTLDVTPGCLRTLYET